MKRHALVGVVVSIALMATSSEASVYTPSAAAASSAGANMVTSVQYWRGWGPGWRWGGRPYWYARPWARRPYYGTIVAGVALGALITVAAVGAVPPRPAPNLCWYWADPYRSRGYWDYCY